MNVALIAVCVALVAIVVKNYLLPSKEEGRSLAKGDRIVFAGGEWQNREKTLLLFLRSGCEFCSNSAPFYAELRSRTEALANVKIAAVFSNRDQKAESYLSSLGLEGLELRRTDFDKVGISGTPTAVLVDEKGDATEFWRGYLSPRKRVEVKQKLGLPAESDFLVDDSGLEKLRRDEAAVLVLDVRDRESFSKGHMEGAKNIPLDELSVRAVNELTAAGPVVICGSVESETSSAYDILAKNGFKKVYILTREIV